MSGCTYRWLLRLTVSQCNLPGHPRLTPGLYMHIHTHAGTSEYTMCTHMIMHVHTHTSPSLKKLESSLDILQYTCNGQTIKYAKSCFYRAGRWITWMVRCVQYPSALEQVQLGLIVLSNSQVLRQQHNCSESEMAQNTKMASMFPADSSTI